MFERVLFGIFIRSAHYLRKQVMLSLGLFVCLLAGLRKMYATDFHKIWWKDGTRATEETTTV